MKHLPLLLLLLATVAGGRAAPILALGEGESLVYHVSWVVVPGAGEIRVSAMGAVDLAGRRELRIISTTSTRGLARLLLPFEARAESLFDPATGRLLWFGESSDTRSRRAAHTVVFDYARRVANYTSGLPPQAAVALPMPAGEPTDLITCLMLARTWNLQPGQKHDALVLFDDQFYQLTIHADGYEDVDTPMGTFRTLVLEPRMEETPPKGMFKRGSTVRVWVSQDGRRLPVRFQVQFKFGSGLATLARYHPPGP
jgi:hypothetical protein